MILAEGEEETQFNLNVLCERLTIISVKLNVNNTKCMIVGNNTNTHSIKLSALRIEQIEIWKYLGSTIEENKLDGTRNWMTMWEV